MTKEVASDKVSLLETGTNYGSINKENERVVSWGASVENAIASSGRLRMSSIMSSNDSVEDSLSYSLRSSQHVSIREHTGQSNIANSSFNLIKNLVGAGVLALPSGVAAFANTPSAMVPAAIWIVAMGSIFAYEFQLIGKTCRLTGSAVTFRQVWEDTMGLEGGAVVSWVNMAKPALGNLAYSMILADTAKSLLKTFGLELTRTASLLGVTLLAILPLCLMKDLDSLTPFSILGTFGIILITFCMGIRYFDGTYDLETNGMYLLDLEDDKLPAFGNYNGCWTGSVLIFAAMIFEAFVAHYNAPRFLAELQNPTMTRYRAVVASAFGFSSLTYILMTAFGFLTFGKNCDGYILNNYSTDDPLATISRIAIAFSVLFTYPIAFIGFRDGVLDIMQVPLEKQTDTNINIITLVLLTVVTILAVFVRDLGFVNAVGGGTLATAIVFVFPALMFQAAIKNQGTRATKSQHMELHFAYVLMVIGILMGAVGVVVEIQATIEA